MRKVFFLSILSVTILLIAGVIILNSRHLLKERLPRKGEVETVGNVYTPYLLLDSTLYFIKHLDESIDRALVKDSLGKAEIELVIADKRLLEMEKLVREGKYDYVSYLSDKFLTSVNRTDSFTRDGINRGEDPEDLMWVIQETIQDQQKIFSKIVVDMPKDQQEDILVVREQSSKVMEELLNVLMGYSQSTSSAFITDNTGSSK